MREAEIRLAEPNDAADISRVLAEAFSVVRQHYTDEAYDVVTPTPAVILKRFEEGPMWVADVEGQIVGTVSLTTEPEGYYVRSMAVSPKAQRLGVGQKLLEAVHDHIAGSEISRIFLYTTYFTPGAKDMYEKSGYSFVRDTTPAEWYGVPGLEMERVIAKMKNSRSGTAGKATAA